MGNLTRKRKPFLGAVPLVAYVGIFLGIPAAAVIFDAFRSATGSFTLANLRGAMSGVYLASFIESLELSMLSTVIAAIVGIVVAIAIFGMRDGPFRRAIMAASGVFASTGGVPLAFSFIATLGNFGMLTRLLSTVGFNIYDHGFSLYSITGLVIVYQYFLIPVMVLVMIPPLDAINDAWLEAARTLGATWPTVWRTIIGPVIFPPFLAASLLLFTDAFAAYATAAALTSGVIPLVPIQIGSLIQGNVVTGEANLGSAMGFGMIVVVGIIAVIYVQISRRSQKWLR